jgi:hypothetical protein
MTTLRPFFLTQGNSFCCFDSTFEKDRFSQVLKQRLIDPYWTDIIDHNEAEVEEALEIIFATDTDPRLILDETKGLYLVNHNTDPYWGDGCDGKGKNTLGHLLMKIRGDIVPSPIEYNQWMETKNKQTTTSSRS